MWWPDEGCFLSVKELVSVQVYSSLWPLHKLSRVGLQSPTLSGLSPSAPLWWHRKVGRHRIVGLSPVKSIHCKGLWVWSERGLPFHLIFHLGCEQVYSRLTFLTRGGCLQHIEFHLPLCVSVYFPGFFICSSVFFPWKVSCIHHSLWSMHPCQIILVIKLHAAECLVSMWLYICYCCCIIVYHNAGVFFFHLYLKAFQGKAYSLSSNWLMWNSFSFGTYSTFDLACQRVHPQLVLVIGCQGDVRVFVR